MRTKTLLLTAALSAAGVATSMAQVFSVNAVGYVQKPLLANKFYLLSNPLIASDNTINGLFAGAPGGTAVYKFDATSATFKTAIYDDIDNAFGPAANAKLTVLPGEGVFVKAPKDVTFTFVGEVPQGKLTNNIPKGLSIVSSQVPQAGKPSKDLGLAANAGDQIFKWDATGQSYKSYVFDDIDNDWTPATPALSLDVGEAVFMNRTKAGAWTRDFNANQ